MWRTWNISFFSYWKTFHGHNCRDCASRFWCGMIGKVQFTAWISLSLADYMLWCSVVNTFQAHFSLGHANNTQTFHSNSWCVVSKFRTIIEGKSGETCPGPDLKCYWEMTDGSHHLPWRYLWMDRLDLSRGPYLPWRHLIGKLVKLKAPYLGAIDPC